MPSNYLELLVTPSCRTGTLVVQANAWQVGRPLGMTKPGNLLVDDQKGVRPVATRLVTWPGTLLSPFGISMSISIGG